MKHFLILLAVMFLIVAVGVVAQTSDKSSSSKDDDNTQATSAQPTATPETATKVPRKYPIAAGVWYPGDPLPKKPSRYYRIRCWPGCHTYGEWANKPES